MIFQDFNTQIPTIVDILASQYNWTIEYIQSLDLGEIQEQLKQIKNRLERERGIKSPSLGSANNTEQESLEKLKQLGIAK